MSKQLRGRACTCVTQTHRLTSLASETTMESFAFRISKSPNNAIVFHYFCVQSTLIEIIYYFHFLRGPDVTEFYFVCHIVIGCTHFHSTNSRSMAHCAAEVVISQWKVEGHEGNEWKWAVQLIAFFPAPNGRFWLREIGPSCVVGTSNCFRSRSGDIMRWFQGDAEHRRWCIQLEKRLCFMHSNLQLT